MDLKSNKIMIPETTVWDRFENISNFQISIRTNINFNENDTEHEYIRLEDIKIPKYFKPVNHIKKYRKLCIAINTGRFIDEIIVNKDNVLIDGYSTYTILKELNYTEWIVRRQEQFSSCKYSLINRKTKEKECDALTELICSYKICKFYKPKNKEGD